MTLHRIIGTETEFGIAARDSDSNDPVSNSLLLINNYPYNISSKVLWDYENENPLLDMRGFEAEGERERPGAEYNRLLNKLLLNGGRLYVDGAHPEYSTPECTNARDLVIYEKAGERIMRECQRLACRIKGGEKVLVYKNNTDGKGNSYGYHENYLVSRQVPLSRIINFLVPFLVTRQIYAGAGKARSESRENREADIPYQISQRADFFESLVDLNTMVKRPIINTRDEPHADRNKYRRLHIIVGDSNMSEYTTFLKVGTTSIAVSMMEEGLDLSGLELEDPVSAIKEISGDTSLKKRVKMTDGRKLTPIEIQEEYLKKAHDFFANREIDSVSREILDKWEFVLRGLAKDPMSLSREIDWVIKKELLLSYMEKKGTDWNDPRIAMMDLQYHDIREDRGLYYALEKDGYVERLISNSEIERGEELPPSDTRAYFRGMCLKKFPKDVYAASWSSILFEAGDSTIKRVQLMEPLRGNESLTKRIIEESSTVEELLNRLAT